MKVFLLATLAAWILGLGYAVAYPSSASGGFAMLLAPMVQSLGLVVLAAVSALLVAPLVALVCLIFRVPFLDPCAGAMLSWS